jgi:ribosomal protein S18 acetylase RimI-like enzyme
LPSWSAVADIAASARAGDTVARVISFVQAMEEATSTDLVVFRHGVALFNSDFPRSWAHNFLRVEPAGRAPSAEELAAEADRLQGERGLAHRQIVVRDEALGGRLEPAFRDRGWLVDRLVYMIHRRPSDRVADTSIVAEVSFDEAKPALEAFVRGSGYGDSDETVRQLVERTLLTARASNVRHFAVVVEGRIASTCQLISDNGTAQIEDVSTFEEFRNRGFARATVQRALDVARADDYDPIFLEADRDDWPRRLYERMGFDPVAYTFSFTRPPDAS